MSSETQEPEGHALHGLPEAPVQRLTRPLVRFLHVQSTAGIFLLACAAFALVVANSPWSEAYRSAWKLVLRVGLAGADLAYPLWYWVNDGLMTIFFFVIGLELKREILIGELRDRQRLALPVAAAAGGALVPALLYFALQRGGEAEAGWAIPMATDIAFVVGCLALLGPRVPHGLKVLLLSLAIVDDLFAVTVIAAFYTETIHFAWLLAGAGTIALMFGLNRFGVRAVSIYVLVGTAAWFFTLKSGVHPTISGVLIGLLTPASAWVPRDALLAALDEASAALRRATPGSGRRVLEDVAEAAYEAVSPLERLEAGLHPWVAFVIMPIFALANAAVPIALETLAHPAGLSVALGLVVGKPLGIVGASFLAVKAGWARLPSGVNWTVMAGAGCLGGIGFTMSIFIASLGFSGTLLRAAKTGVLVGSFVSAVLGMLLLWWSLRPPQATAESAASP